VKAVIARQQSRWSAGDTPGGAAASVAPRPEQPPDPAVPGEGSCTGAECFALMVLGDSMRPEFDQGDVVIIEPEGLARSGSFVLAFCDGEWILRQLQSAGDGWLLRALDSRYEPIAIPDLGPVRGVIIQKSKPGRRRAVKRYVC